MEPTDVAKLADAMAIGYEPTAPPVVAGMAPLLAELDEAERKAWQSLARYKFVMFGYWAGVWVHLNRVGKCRRSNPWRGLVHAARHAVEAEGGSNG